MKSKLPHILLAALLMTAASPAVPVTWTVTAAGEGHAVVNPADAKPGMDAIIGQAKTFLTGAVQTLILKFPAGTYQFHHPTSAGIYLNNLNQGVQDQGSLVLQGDGQVGQSVTTLVFDQFDQVGLNIVSCQRVTAAGMHLTRPGLQVTQGDVMSVTPGKVHFKVHAGFPNPVTLFGLGAGYERTLIGFTRADPLDPHMDPSYGKVSVNRIVSTGGGEYDAFLSNTNERPPWPAGQWVALKCKTGAFTNLLKDGTDCIIRNVRFTNSAINALRAVGKNQNMIVDGVSVDRAPAVNGKAPCFSSPAGGPQIFCGNEGATIINCKITATADDGIGYFSDDPNDPAVGGLIENNIVRDNQARGIIIASSAGGICQNNSLIRNNDSSILIKNIDYMAGNVGSVKNWTIGSNTFTEAWVASVISLEADAVGSGWAGQPHNNIWIQDNTFIRAPRASHLVSVGYSDDILIRRNTVESYSTVSDYDLEQTGNALVFVKANVAPTAFIHGGLNATVPLVPQGRLPVGEAAGVPPGARIEVVWPVSP